MQSKPKHTNQVKAELSLLNQISLKNINRKQKYSVCLPKEEQRSSPQVCKPRIIKLPLGSGMLN